MKRNGSGMAGNTSFVAGVLLLTFMCATAHAAGTWTATGSMGVDRQSHTATLLANGKVLVVGGAGGGAYQKSAELYDPGTGTWSGAGNMTTTRCNHSATLLGNGKVLVVGGISSSMLSSAELYDPVTGAWSATGSMATARQGQRASLLPDGKVLVSGGQEAGGGRLSSAEVYDPATGVWANTGSMGTARDGHTATVLPNGKVLVLGGYTGGSFTGTAELYDPASGTWTATGGLAVGRYYSTATLLPNGKVLVTGGYGGGALSSADLYDPAAGTWSGTGNMSVGRGTHVAALLPNGKVLVAGAHASAPSATAEVYDPTAGTWSDGGTLSVSREAAKAVVLANGTVLVTGGYNGPAFATCELYTYAAGDSSWSATGSMAADRCEQAAALLPNGEVLVAGGTGSGGITAASEIFNPSTGVWRSTGNLVIARYHHTATLLPNGRVLIAGGWVSGGATAEIFDPATDTSTATGSMTELRWLPIAVLLPNGKVLVAGGYNNSASAISSADLYNPAAGTWSATGSMNSVHGGSAGVLLPNGKVLVVGGELGGNNASASSELYDPAAGTWSNTGSLLAARWQCTAVLLPNGKVLVAGGRNGGTSLASTELYDPATGTWSSAGSMSVGRVCQTATVLPDGTVLVAGGWDYATSSCPTSTELYDPATGTWSAGASLAVGRFVNPAIRLGDGRVLVAGGYNGSSSLASCEVFDPGLGYQPGWRPVINTATSPLAPGGKLVLSGSGFKGISEASGGGPTGSATNYPLVQLRSLLNDQTAFLLSDPTSNWSNTEFVSAPVSGFPKGYASVTVFTNGIPSESKTILISDTAPTITSALTASGTVGASFSYQITATNSPTSFGATNLPGGLSVDAAGAITGTPTAAGTTDVTISATNAGGTGSATLQITISTQAPSITSLLTATGTVGQSFSYEITASGSTPMTFSAAPLPAGLSLSGAIISGTSSTEGVTDVTLGASNASGSDSKVLKITINPSGAPTITSELTATGQVGTAFEYIIAASGNAPITFNATDLPAWASFSTDRITGTPPATGTASVTISATNASGTDTKTLEITINAAGAPTITSALTAKVQAGTAFSYEIKATGTGTITFGTGTLPGWLTFDGTATLTGTPQAGDVGTVKITLTAANASGTDTKELQITVSPVVGDPPVITDILRSRNPVRTSTDVTFAADAVSPSGLPLTFTWFFFDPDNKQEGPPVAGQTVVRQFPAEGYYTVVAIAFDGFSKSTNFTKVSVTLEPNSGSDAANVTVGVNVVNPNGGLGISVPDSKGGVVDLDLVDSTAGVSPASRTALPFASPSYQEGEGGVRAADETFTTRIPTLPDSYDGRALAGKFSLPEVFVIETTGTTLGGVTRKARMMVPVSNREAGLDTTVTDQRTNKGLVKFDVKGKFNFGARTDGVTLKTEIELPAGVSPSLGMPISLGIGNVTGKGLVDGKGRVTGISGVGVKKVQVKWPRLDKANPVTKGGEKAKVTISMKGTSLDAAGFDTDGVVNTGLTEKQAVPRQIQTAIVLGGVSYYAQSQVNYTLKRGTGMLQGRTPR